MVIKIVKLTGPEFPSIFKYDEGEQGAMSLNATLSGVKTVLVSSDDHQNVIELVHDIEVGEIRVMHYTNVDEAPECILSILQ